MLKPGDRIGILGGGQLARMLALAAAPLGLDCHVYCPDEASPAFQVAARSTVAAYDDEAALAAFAADVAVVTYEFENVPAATAAFLSARVPVLPGPNALATTQDRLAEKDFVNAIGLSTPAYRAVDSLADLERAAAELGRPSVLKTRRFGYDGKGQAMVRPGVDLAEAWNAIGMQPAILEAFVPFEREVSVVAARGADGTVAAFDVCENVHRHHILALTTVPAALGPEASRVAVEHAARIATKLDYVGVLAVEMFALAEDGRERILVNEIAPRVHNSGHWTIEGAETSQFEQHVRAIAGWPLGSPARLGRIEMRNLVGDEAAGWLDMLRDGHAHLHLYGKAEARAGRKMGHVTRVLRG
ncbi:5-(carboxyamino)imidazole ribonucleotide synthase [Alsobacter sp. SYSU M60028]|uniref:N5-carboxyaminoimidazole ribonucleotide synthase n=1 Tax=Alsobacter ponti TaxID=2962936 RepID=A0ABT1LE60_9HYPH|nr:5-(carboxyamino)imidazole ribonucleotide synthase [Alsobacter ponti]MCP8939796.1 5-(carboxyamino)imidazole ribonucleotide synthase [Alsobacter ponti]